MKPIAKNEIFNNLSGFLKSRGIELTDGSYSQGIRQSCSLLTDAINLGQESLVKAKTEIEKTCEQMRHVIHEKTAPKSAKAAGPAQPTAKPSGAKAPKSGTRKSPKTRKTSKS
jgi:hypothetical protein